MPPEPEAPRPVIAPAAPARGATLLPPSPPLRPATPGAPADVDALLAAFLEGAHATRINMPAGVTPELMRTMGTIAFQAVAGVMGLIAARQITKREIGAEVTMIVANGNNPLKFLPTADAAMMQILGPKMPGFMAPAEAMIDAFDDLRAHEVGVIAGTRAAFAEMLRRFDPKALEQRLGKGGLLDSVLPAARRAKLWDLFETRFNELYREAQDDFDSLFGKAFTDAYEQEVARHRGQGAERRGS